MACFVNEVAKVKVDVVRAVEGAVEGGVGPKHQHRNMSTHNHQLLVNDRSRTMSLGKSPRGRWRLCARGIAWVRGGCVAVEAATWGEARVEGGAGREPMRPIPCRIGKTRHTH